MALYSVLPGFGPTLLGFSSRFGHIESCCSRQWVLFVETPERRLRRIVSRVAPPELALPLLLPLLNSLFGLMPLAQYRCYWYLPGCRLGVMR